MIFPWKGGRMLPSKEVKPKHVKVISWFITWAHHNKTGPKILHPVSPNRKKSKLNNFKDIQNPYHIIYHISGATSASQLPLTHSPPAAVPSVFPGETSPLGGFLLFWGVSGVFAYPRNTNTPKKKGGGLQYQDWGWYEVPGANSSILMDEFKGTR